VLNSKRRFSEAIVVCMLLCLAMPVYTYAASNRIHYNDQDLFLNGANLAWEYFANDIGPATYSPNMTYFDSVFSQFQANGGNCMRLWLHTTGAYTPAFDSNGTVIGPGTNTIADLQTILDDAWSHKVSVMCCLWSFDMLQNNNNHTDWNKNILTNSSKMQAYIDTSLVPMVTALRGHPAIVAWEIFNEPEGMTTQFGWSAVRVDMSNIQWSVNKMAGAIHRADPNARVTNGSWSFYATTDKPAGSGNYNYYTDARLITAGGDPNGYLDFYCVHYYDWAGTARSPFDHPYSYWGLDKPLVVAEFYPPPPGCNTCCTDCGTAPYENLYQNGYAGALTWSWTDSNHASMLGQMLAMWNAHQADVDIIKGYNFKDFAGFASQWNRIDCNAGNNWCSGADFNRDGVVEIDDLATFAEEWLSF